MDPDTIGHLCALLSGLGWAFAVILFKKSGEQIPPPVLNLYKGIVASLIFLPLLLVFSRDVVAMWPSRVWWLILVSAVIGITISDTLFFMALNRLGAGMNAVVDCVYAPAMTLMAMLFLRERPTFWILVGGSLILAGIFVGGMTRPGPGCERRHLVSGFLYGAAAMVTVAASVVIMKPWFTTENLIPITTLRLVVGSLFLLPPVLAHRRYRESFFALLRPSRLWWYALPGSILGGALAMLLWIAGFTLLDMTTASILNQVSTIYIFILATVILKEPLTARRTAAIALALIGALVVILGQP